MKKKELTIKNGIIAKNNEPIGTAMMKYKFGYHPAIYIKLNNNKSIWFEQDEKDLRNKILNWVEDNYQNESV